MPKLSAAGARGFAMTPQEPAKSAKTTDGNIRNALIAAGLSGTVTLIVVIIAICGTSVMGFGVANLIDVVLIFGLAFGVYKRSRTCAIILAVYGGVNAIYMTYVHGISIMQFILEYFYIMAVPATFAHHKAVMLAEQGGEYPAAAAAAAPSQPPPLVRSYRIAAMGKDIGEHSPSTIRKMLREGSLSLTDYYFDHGTNAWQPLQNISEFRP